MKLSFLALCVYLAFLFFQPWETFPGLAAIRPAYSVGVLTLVLAFLEKAGQGGLHLPRGKQTLLLLGFYLVALLSMSQAVSWEASSYALAELTKMMGLYFLVLLVIDSDVLLVRFASVLVAFTTIQAVTSMLVYYVDKTASVKSRLRLGSYFGGMAGDPNDFSLLLVMMIPFALAFLELRRSRIQKGYYLLALTTFLYNITRSQSRGGFLGLVMILTQILWAKRRRPALILVACALAALVFLKTPSSYWERMRTITSAAETDGSMLLRQQALEKGLEFVQRSPLLGIGIGNFLTTWRWEQPELTRTAVAHNTVIQIGAEMGLLGLGLYLALIFVAWKSALAAERHFAASGLKELFAIAQATRIGLVGFAFTSLFLSQQFSRILYMLIALSVLLPEFAKWSKAEGQESQEVRTEGALVTSGRQG